MVWIVYYLQRHSVFTGTGIVLGPYNFDSVVFTSRAIQDAVSLYMDVVSLHDGVAHQEQVWLAERVSIRVYLFVRHTAMVSIALFLEGVTWGGNFVAFRGVFSLQVFYPGIFL